MVTLRGATAGFDFTRCFAVAIEITKMPRLFRSETFSIRDLSIRDYFDPRRFRSERLV
jgi:hypothetical protein